MILGWQKTVMRCPDKEPYRTVEFRWICLPKNERAVLENSLLVDMKARAIADMIESLSNFSAPDPYIHESYKL
jgi:hypothetical protein